MSELLQAHLLGGIGKEKGVNLFPIYERHFSRFQGLSPVVLEIGVNTGASLPLWKMFFGGNSRINGLDINPECAKYNNPSLGVNVFIGDATDPTVLDAVLEKIGIPDIVIDDGSHVSTDIRKTFEHLYPKIYRNGVYLVEDLHMAYFEGQPVQDSFIEYAKGLMDELNAGFRVDQPRKWFSHGTISMTSYESVIVFERGLPLLLEALGDRYLEFSNGGMQMNQVTRPVPNDQG